LNRKVINSHRIVIFVYDCLFRNSSQNRIQQEVIADVQIGFSLG
jgi:hypothetical protein